MAGAAPLAMRRVVCPFCALGCDDLTVERTEDGLRVTGGCAEGRERIERPPAFADPSAEGRVVTLQEAAARAAEILRGARLPLIAGLGTDVAGVRAALALADRCGGVVDHMGSAGLMRNLRVLQDTGTFTTTLSEVRSRADLFLLVGSDPADRAPRLVERILDGSPPLTGGTRRAVRIGPPGGDGSFEVIACETADLPASVATLRALARGAVISGAPDGLPEIADALKGAAYGVVSWDASAFADPWGELVVEALVGLIRDLNATGGTRTAGLPLAGGDGLVGAGQVCAWQAGWPLRTAFTAEGPAHDPVLHSAERLLASGEADALVWVSAFREIPPPETGLPTILVATPGTDAAGAAVWIPVGTPGLDHGGRLFRMDGVVALPLTALRDSPLPSATQVLAEIEAALA